jgi:hypothetical protein
MATKALRTLSIYRQEGNDGVVIERKPGEEASMTFKKGCPLVYDIGETSSQIEEWAGGADASRIIGIAAIDATGTENTAVPYYEANDYNLFEGSLITDTAAYTLLGTEVGSAFGLVKSGTDWYVDTTAADGTHLAIVEVVGLIDAVGDVNPRVIIRFLGGKQSKVLQS